MITVQMVAEVMEELAPADLAEKWDNVGLLCGRRSSAVSRILVALDLDHGAVLEAIGKQADLLLTHHPFLMKPIQRVTDETREGGLVLTLAEHGIAHFAAHTNLDSARGGVNDALADALGLRDISDLLADGFEGSGRIGRISPVPLADFARTVGHVLGSRVVKTVGDQDMLVKTVGVCGGSGGFFIEGALRQECDVLVTGEAKYHEEQLAYENGIAMIEAGHFESEQVVCPVLCDYLSQRLPGVEVLLSERTETYYY